MRKAKIITLVSLVLFFVVVCSPFSQDNDDSRNSDRSSVKETAKEAWGLYIQYRRIINEAGNYWEDEITTGLSSGRYTNSMFNRQYYRIKTIFDRLLKSEHLARELNKYNWRIYLQNSNTVNAFAALNGIIIINKGIIDFCQNDDELALIIGHEIAHMAEDHIKKQIGTRVVMDPIIERISAFIAQKKNKRLKTEEISDKEIADREMFQIIFGLSGELALLKYNRSQEEKADEIGAKYAASVGYDTDKGYALWTRMSDNFGSPWLNFLSTHPKSDHRAKNFLEGDYMRKYYKVYTED
ncbi:MAG: M48 family metalloprotease [Treponema sp.]|nr:M48 family metalloprotease [Treponema sp.]